jgi:hypothetical protein
MKLADEVRRRAGVTRAYAAVVMNKHAGEDPLRHHWRMAPGGPRGAHVYRLLEPPHADPSEAAAA